MEFISLVKYLIADVNFYIKLTDLQRFKNYIEKTYFRQSTPIVLNNVTQMIMTFSILNAYHTHYGTYTFC